jgi:hypothetical protein
MEGYRKAEEARRLREATFPSGMLTGTGSELWTALWEAARRFSHESAYPRIDFPVVENGAHCVLCQQELDHAASHRLEQFEAFVSSTTEKELRELRQSFAQLRKTFTDVRMTEAKYDVLGEIRIEHEALADAIATAIDTNENRREAVALALTENKDLADNCPDLVCIAHEAYALAEQLQSRIKTLRDNTTDEILIPMSAEARELRARKLLAKYQQIVLDEIERKKKYAAYGPASTRPRHRRSPKKVQPSPKRPSLKSSSRVSKTNLRASASVTLRLNFGKPEERTVSFTTNSC